MRASSLLISASLLTAASVSPATADVISFTVTNAAAEAVSTITGTPVGAAEPSTENLLTAAIASTAEATVSIDRPDKNCLYDLQIGFVSGKVEPRSGVDICQLDGLVIE